MVLQINRKMEIEKYDSLIGVVLVVILITFIIYWRYGKKN